MREKSRLGTRWLGAILVAFLVMAGGPLRAATRAVTGALGVINPSVAPPFFFEGGPGVFGRAIGAYAPTDGFKTVSVDGTTTGTFVGRRLTLASGLLDFSGRQLRDFPAFANVANLTKTFRSVQEQARFEGGGGALAACPGPGCTQTGGGSAISWCPPLAQPVTPAPGTASSPVGDWDCPSWPAGAGGGNRFLRLGISNAPGASHFGGTLHLLRNVVTNVWRVLVQPGTQGTLAEVSRTLMLASDKAWTGGRSNFDYTPTPAYKGPRILAALNSRGAISKTYGCVNGVGTVGGSFSPGQPITVPGSNCGTPTSMDPDAQGWGFRMTTGTIDGSDPFPFGLVITSAAPPGTPFAPNVGTQSSAAGFFFTRMGTDRVTGSERNLVLLGGGIAVAPSSGNAFFRITDLRLRLVPEPAPELALWASLGGLALLAAGRRAL